MNPIAVPIVLKITSSISEIPVRKINWKISIETDIKAPIKTTRQKPRFFFPRIGMKIPIGINQTIFPYKL